MESRESALAKAASVAAEMESMRPRAAANRLREGVGETATYLPPEFPDGHRRRIRTNNMIGRAEPGDPPAHARRGKLPRREWRVDARMRRNPLRHRERMVDPPLSGHVPAR